MKKAYKIGLALIVAAVVVVGAVFGVMWFKHYKVQKANAEQVAIAAEQYKLDSLVIQQHHCDQAIPQAQDFLAQHPAATAIWLIKGGCEFDLAKNADATASFQKVLSLDPQNKAAQNYLQALKTQPGEVVIHESSFAPGGALFGSNVFLEKQLESAIGFTPDPSLLLLPRVEQRPTSTTISLALSGAYYTNSTAAQLKTYFDKTLTAAKLKYTFTQDTTGSFYQVTLNQKEDYIISVWARTPIVINIDYVKHN